MPDRIPYLYLENGAVINCQGGGIIGRQGDLASAELSGEAVLSRRHLLLQQHDATWFLTLLPDARNTTWLDGEVMMHGSARQIYGQHDLQIGDKHFGIALIDPSTPDPWAAVTPAPSYLPSMDFDDPLPGSTASTGGGDMVAALECLQSVPGVSFLLDDDLRVWWYSSMVTDMLGDTVFFESDFLALVESINAPDVRSALEELRGNGGSVKIQLPGIESPLLFTYRYPYFLGHDLDNANSSGGAVKIPTAGLLGSLASNALSQAFQVGDVAKAVTMVTAEAVQNLKCRRVSMWFAETNDANELVCRSASTAHGAAAAGARVKMNYCPMFFDNVRGSPPLASAREGEPVFSILKEIGFLDAGAHSVLATAIQQGGTFHGLFVIERDESAGEWSEAEKNYAVCATAMCLLAMQTRSSTDTLADLKEKEALLAGGLAEARRYVRRLLPEPLRHPDVCAEWHFEPSETLGGDAFGYHWLDENLLAMYVLDVVGHGTGAALLAVSVANALRSKLVPAEDFTNPADVLAAVNRSFQMEEQGMMTFTAWYGVYDKIERTIIYSSAGHPPALLVWPNHEGAGMDFRELGTEGLIIGGMDDAVYTNDIIAIGPELTKLYMYSDGAFEIPLGPNRNWTFEEFIASVRATRTMTSGEPEYLYERARTLCASDTLPDDFSMVRLLFPPFGESLL